MYKAVAIWQAKFSMSSLIYSLSSLCFIAKSVSPKSYRSTSIAVCMKITTALLGVLMHTNAFTLWHTHPAKSMGFPTRFNPQWHYANLVSVPIFVAAFTIKLPEPASTSASTQLNPLGPAIAASENIIPSGSSK